MKINLTRGSDDKSLPRPGRKKAKATKLGLTPVPWTEKKKQLKVRHFSSDTEVIAAAVTWLDGQRSDFFF